MNLDTFWSFAVSLKRADVTIHLCSGHSFTGTMARNTGAAATFLILGDGQVVTFAVVDVVAVRGQRKVKPVYESEARQ